jgi:hypothetical protein
MTRGQGSPPSRSSAAEGESGPTTGLTSQSLREKVALLIVVAAAPAQRRGLPCALTTGTPGVQAGRIRECRVQLQFQLRPFRAESQATISVAGSTRLCTESPLILKLLWSEGAAGRRQDTASSHEALSSESECVSKDSGIDLGGMSWLPVDGAPTAGMSRGR